MVVAAPNLAAITHWFAPFPPKPIRNSDPNMVSPGLREGLKEDIFDVTSETCYWRQRGPWRWRRWTQWRHFLSQPFSLSVSAVSASVAVETHTDHSRAGTSFKFMMFTDPLDGVRYALTMKDKGVFLGHPHIIPNMYSSPLDPRYPLTRQHSNTGILALLGTIPQNTSRDDDIFNLHNALQNPVDTEQCSVSTGPTRLTGLTGTETRLFKKFWKLRQRPDF